MGTLLLALVAGVLTVLNPCVLPVLPIVLLGALEEHRLGPMALAGGMVASFTGVSLLIYGAGASLDLSPDAARIAGAVLMLVFGAVLLVPALKQQLASAGAPLAGLAARFAPQGLGGQFALGALLGAVWSPCTGPTLGSAFTLAARSDSLGRAAGIMLAFGVGAGLPMAALAYGSQRTLKARRARYASFSRVALPIMGAALVVLGLAILSGADRVVETALTDAMPEWLLGLTTRF
jgi:cytochrome c-type biogenesis protein